MQREGIENTRAYKCQNVAIALNSTIVQREFTMDHDKLDVDKMRKHIDEVMEARTGWLYQPPHLLKTHSVLASSQRQFVLVSRTPIPPKIDKKKGFDYHLLRLTFLLVLSIISIRICYTVYYAKLALEQLDK